tara:strand:+ start:664 stop:813 length:150 start_codon:yes stop_codon:yes gene_type:complete
MHRQHRADAGANQHMSAGDLSGKIRKVMKKTTAKDAENTGNKTGKEPKD